MGYKVIFLNTEDYPFLSEDECSCEVCREIERNVIEPVVLFVDENEDIENLSEERIRELIEENKELLGQSESRCIFHCEKENEVWIKNFEAYINYLRKEKPENEKTFDEKLEDLFTPNQILWDDYLVNEFWKRIRIYRFCIDYWKKEDIPKDLQFIEENKEIKDLLKFYREKIQNDPDKYDFRGVIFPRVQQEKTQVSAFPNAISVKYFSFWFEKEQFYFSKVVDFKGSIFVDEMLFGGVHFVKIADFIGSTFKRKIEFKVVNFKNNLYFNNSKFKGDVLFFKVIFEKLVGFNEAKFKRRLIIESNSEFKRDVEFKETKFGFETNFSKIVFHGKVNFWNTDFAGNVNFSGAEFLGDSDFREMKVLGNASFQNAEFKKNADFWRSKFSGNVNFFKAEFYGNLNLAGGEFTGESNFGEIKICGIAKFNQRHFLQYTNFEKAQFNSNVDFEKACFRNKINFNNVKFLNQVKFAHVEFKEKVLFKDVILKGNANFKGVQFYKKALFILKNIENSSIDFSYIILFDTTHLEIRNLKTKRLIMNNLTNYAKEFIFFNLELLEDEEDKPSLEIKNSILNKMRFVNCNFSNVKDKKIEIENSSLSSCEFANVFWGDIREERICHSLINSNNKKDILKARDIYRQLKLAHDNHKDFIQGSEFYALEMRAHEKYLSKFKKGELTFFLWKDKILFKISKIASNYAQDWVNPLKWIISILFFITVIDCYLNTSSNSTSTLLLFFSVTFFYLSLKISIEIEDTSKWLFLWGLSFGFLGMMNESQITLTLSNYTPINELNLFLFVKNVCVNVFSSLILFLKQIVKSLGTFFDVFFKFIKPWETFLSNEKTTGFCFSIEKEKIDFCLKFIYQIDKECVLEFKKSISKTFFGISWISMSYLIYQLIVSLRRKIRR